ncbi:DUF4858 domain-containing protein [Bacteroides hominis]|uniref:DUF4858 domain-containing protein n=1 Tax=Bacteroides TaxID=816 RepID=UPI000C765AE7|nr:DUF4858 domain-containing protein [Bacteroides fragilis]AUI47034.1 DUF4858 domain-containing protein [Bacteroides fragilis]MCE8557811.1 DUF4858 domain-containing protein [Bacteroides fragilis]MCY6328060.1 DUF4858 domain-containing protein [Bacteroides fragilis]
MRFILFIIFSLCLPLVMQGQEQNVWTQNDSLKLKKVLAGQAEIRINQKVLRELDRVFSSPRRLFKFQSRSAILPIKDFLFYRPNVFSKYHISTFKVNELNIWQDSLFMKVYMLGNKQLFIKSQLDTGDSRVLIKRKTDIQFKFTDHLAYRVYGGYTIDKNRTVILPTTATPYYVGTGFSYSLNKKLQLKTGIEYQYNVVYKRWEWVWNSGIRFNF